ncbi:GNAT family N-acetyltransferase [Anaeroselena agilis]|uniref:GNAT family N-acetyltransferase n=1 Tax=Anaeroselena agilis TaxID=3063788 RepID=A0ABU3NVF8_9FIRM|nr:GNAT family N-acetyltransferase [Selenomonadales bacterium 4137-cl]
MKDKGFVVRTMERHEVELAVEWAAREGWNPGLHDAACFFAADREGFLLGSLDGEPVGCVSAVRYGHGYGFLGFYIVAPEQRGRGLGIQLWQAAMDRLAGRNIGLDGVLAQQDNYRKSGFSLAYRNARYEGADLTGGRVSDRVVPLAELGLAAVADYDGAVFGADRAAFLRAWVEQPEGVALGLRRGTRLAGYGVLRPCRVGFKIGPLFADDGEAAEELFIALTAHTHGAPVYLDVPEPNALAGDLVRRHRMKEVFATARMYSQHAPAVPLDKVFGVTTFELG